MKRTTQFATFIAVCLLAGQTAFAQPSGPGTKNIFRAGAGVGQYMGLDLQYSPNLYQVHNVNLDLGFQHNNGNGIFLTGLKLSMGAVHDIGKSVSTIFITDTDFNGNDGVETHKLSFSQMSVNFEAGYLHQVPSPVENTRFMAGGSIEENFTYTPAVMYPGTINYLSANARVRADFMLNNGKRLSAGLAFPAVALVTRMPYHNSPVFPDKNNLKAYFTGNNNVETVNHFQNIKASVRYEFFNSENLSMDVTLEGSWMHYSKPEHLTSAGGRVSLGISF